MYRQWTVLVLVLVLFVVGCGGGSGNVGVKSTTPKPLVLKNIVFLGDSITQLGTYPTVVATTLGATAVNAGISGQEISAMLARVDTDVIAQHPDLCVLFAGTNDAYFATPIAQFQADYDAVLQKLKAAKIPVVVVTPPHFGVGEMFQNRDLNTSLVPVVAAIRAEATAHNLTVAEVNNATIPLNADGEHPTAAGQATIAEIVTTAIRSASSTGRY
ncbi:MAG: family lipolytic protein [Chthonomonadales bacterium]|nr:family lipolytic protein [Chthonomonadales bacterium]